MGRKLWKIVTKSIVVLSIASVCAGVLFGIVGVSGGSGVPGGSQIVKAARDSSQIQFNAGNDRYLTYLKICGVNQNNSSVCWSKYTYQQQYVTLYNWWWK